MDDEGALFVAVVFIYDAALYGAVCGAFGVDFNDGYLYVSTEFRFWLLFFFRGHFVRYDADLFFCQQGLGCLFSCVGVGSELYACCVYVSGM